MIAEILRARPVAAVTEGEKHVPLAVEHHASAEMAAAVRLRQRPEQHLHVGEPVAVEPAASELGSVAAAVRAGVGDVDEAVMGEIRVQHHIVQPAPDRLPPPPRAARRSESDPACRPLPRSAAGRAAR